MFTAYFICKAVEKLSFLLFLCLYAKNCKYRLKNKISKKSMKKFFSLMKSFYLCLRK